jgi:4-hydroxy-2-oxoheptanedioate aldolase
MSETKADYYGGGHGPDPKRMRRSRVLSKIRAGGVASCSKTNLNDQRVIEIMGMAGIDCLWLCSEHVPVNYAELECMVRAAKLYDMDTVLRVPRGSYTDYIRGFEMDAAGIMVPHIMSYQDACDVVRMTKFPPMGRRALDGGNIDGGFCRYKLEDYLRDSNTERWVVYQIEDPEVLPDLERIAELPGVDMLLFGPGDFSLSIGKPGQTFDPEVDKVRRRVAQVARKAGKIAGTVSSFEKLQYMVDLGYNFVNVGADVLALNDYFDKVAATFKAAKLPS